MNSKMEKIIEQLNKVIVGKEEVIRKVLMAVLSGGHVLLEDNPGVGKTTLALAISRVLGLDYRRMQFTSDSVPSDIIGFTFYDKQKGEFLYREGAVMTNLLLADEINRTSSRTQSALLEVMEEGQVTVDGNTYQVPKPFLVLATQNPVGSVGTQMLPPAQLDRFMVRIHMGYPDFQSQVEILRSRHHANPLDNVQTIISDGELLAMQEEASRIHVEDIVYEYIVQLAQKTREHEDIELGLSPRGMLAVAQMAKAAAYMEGRDYVIPQDVKDIFCDTTAHRMLLNSHARMVERSASDILESILSEVQMPLWK